MAKSKPRAFRAIEEFGGQYRTIHGGIVTIGPGDVTVEADVDSMYVEKGGKLLLKFGWEPVDSDLPEASPLTAEEIKAVELIKASERNLKLKEKSDGESDT